MQKTRLSILICLSLISVNSLYSEETVTSNYTVSTKIELTETAINRFLMNEYTTNGIPQIITGNVNGVSYTLNLALPRVILLQDAMKLHMDVGITGCATYL
jgi:hypothetical protein